MKNYPPDFKADVVALYQLRPRATIKQIAADLGINPGTLRHWNPGAAGASRPSGHQADASTPALEAENAALHKKIRELEEEREIMRKAAKEYFAGGCAGEPLPVRRRPPAPSRREADLRHPHVVRSSCYH
ncbi:transposase [Streptomyces sp. NBC_00233]|uniref:transposase n=1 Tax=Streptomyces sp. NBC_00233 TaxID=2975686 RepID=UPI0022545B31|nr:transposase [Streptomyces sp. NBC_00233]MCX5233365.1 transposase [Streptomyces sp. NBC_00233]